MEQVEPEFLIEAIKWNPKYFLADIFETYLGAFKLWELFRKSTSYIQIKTGKEVFIMKKTYKIDVDCANCANKMEQAAKNTDGVKDATVNFMMLKMIVEFEEGADPKKVMKEVQKNCKVVEDDCEIFL